MIVEIGRLVANEMAVILGVVPAEEGPCAFAIFAMQVAYLVQRLVLCQDDGGRLDALASEGGGLPHEAVYYAGVVLREHGRHPVPLG